MPSSPDDLSSQALLAGLASRNGVLHSLTPLDFQRLSPWTSRVRLSPGQVLMQAGASPDSVYFPEEGMVCLVSGGNGPGAGVQLAVVGDEGGVGLQEWVVSAPAALATAVVHVGGGAIRMALNGMDHVSAQMPALRQAVLAAVHGLTMQQLAVSAGHARDSLLQRCVQWLLRAQDRVHSNEVPVTHDLLATRLAVRRSGVTVAIASLQAKALIRTGRGRIIILDRDTLSQIARHGLPNEAA